MEEYRCMLKTIILYKDEYLAEAYVEYHFFFSCKLYNDLRSSLFDYLRQDVPDFDTLDLNKKNDIFDATQCD